MADVKSKCVVESYVLKLSANEARAIRTVLSRIGGDICNSPRVYTDEVLEALDRAGVESFPESVLDKNSGKKGEIYFRETL
jgi:hypothetical protein